MSSYLVITELIPKNKYERVRTEKKTNKIILTALS